MGIEVQGKLDIGVLLPFFSQSRSQQNKLTLTSAHFPCCLQGRGIMCTTTATHVAQGSHHRGHYTPQCSTLPLQMQFGRLASDVQYALPTEGRPHDHSSAAHKLFTKRVPAQAEESSDLLAEPKWHTPLNLKPPKPKKQGIGQLACSRPFEWALVGCGW